jgi:predicted methyltransferase
MKRFLCQAAVLSILSACGGDPPPPAAPPPAPPAAPDPTPVATTTAAEPTKPAEPTPEELKKAEAAKKLAEERAKWDDTEKAETARWTPELHAEAKALADKNFPDTKAALTAAMAGHHRKPGDADRDKYRHPVETLNFFGLKPNMTVLDIGPGDGWYTELLAPELAKKGKLFVTGGDPNGPAEARGTFYAQKFQAFLNHSPELYGKVQPIVIDGKAPSIGQDGTLDMVLIMRGVHGMHNNGTFKTWLAEINKGLKPNGVLGIEEHRAKADANPDESAKKGYVPEKWVIDTVEAAGFKLSAKSEINANAKDTKDYPEGVWTLPPTYELKDKDHDKYAAIGESDRMTLKFTKVTPKDAKAAAPKTAAPATTAAPKPATPPATKP